MGWLSAIFAESSVTSLTSMGHLLVLNSSQLPLCSPFPGPLSVLVIDNTRIHHGNEIIELLSQYGMLDFLTAIIDPPLQVSISYFSPLILLTSIPLRRHFRRSKHGFDATTTYFQLPRERI